MIVIQPRDGGPSSFIGPFTIGRRAGPGPAQPATYQIEDELASVLHCRIGIVLDRWSVEDLGSTNGTWVNGIRVRTVPCRLKRGDVIRVGHTELIVVPDPD